MIGQGEDILAWLETAISEREQKATEAAVEYGARWYYDEGFVLARREDDMVATGSQDFLDRPQGDHIALNDPESVLRRCAADRKAVELYVETVAIRDRSAASIQAAQDSGIRPDPCVLDDWSRANREAAFMLPLIQILSEGYGWTEGEHKGAAEAPGYRQHRSVRPCHLVRKGTRHKAHRYQLKPPGGSLEWFHCPGYPADTEQTSRAAAQEQTPPSKGDQVT